MSTEEYPPADHVLRDLDVELEATPDGGHIARYTPAGEGRTELGGVLTVVDLLAGARCLDAIDPDWMATSGMTFHLGSAVPTGGLRVVARIARAGRTTVVVRVEAYADDFPTPFGEGVVTFARLVRRDGNLSVGGSRFEPGSTVSFASRSAVGIGRGGSLRRAIGCRIVEDRGTTLTELGEYVRNSFGAMNGGVVATIVESTALAALRGSDGTDAHEVVDVAVHYLAQGRVGPVRADPTVLRAGGPGSSSLVRVEVIDVGAPEGERVMAVAHVGVAPHARV